MVFNRKVRPGANDAFVSNGVKKKKRRFQYLLAFDFSNGSTTVFQFDSNDEHLSFKRDLNEKGLAPDCLVPRCGGISYTDLPTREEIWDRYYMEAPQRQRGNPSSNIT